jgi:hypothetical protein
MNKQATIKNFEGKHMGTATADIKPDTVRLPKKGQCYTPYNEKIYLKKLPCGM